MNEHWLCIRYSLAGRSLHIAQHKDTSHWCFRLCLRKCLVEQASRLNISFVYSTAGM